MPPCSPGPTSARRTCVVPDFVMQSWTRPTSAMQGWAARSWLGPPCAVRTCGARIFAWQFSTVRIYPMPILDGADGLTQAQLERARLNNGTKLPGDLTGVEDAER